jgi:Flp pilus assembly protein TadG
MMGAFVGLNKFWKKLTKDNRGATAVIFTLCIIPIIGAVGLAIDYGNAFRASTMLQSAVDSASLAAVKQGSRVPGKADAAAHLVFDENSRHRSMLQNINVQVVKGSDGVYTVTATGTMPVTFMSALGFSKMNLSAVSKATAGSGVDAEIVLVLDNTQSMTGARIDALTAAADALITQVDATTDPSHWKIGLVPFGQYVNVGRENRSAPWLSVPNDYQTSKTHCSMEKSVIGKSNCRMVTQTVTKYARGEPYDVVITKVIDGVTFTTTEIRYTQGAPYDTTVSNEVCDYQYGDPVRVCETKTDKHAWHGCVGSRNAPLNTEVDVASTNPVPGLMDISCTAPLTRMTNDPAIVRAAINQMSASGETYLPAGLIWGWRVLSDIGPFADGAGAADKPVRKVMVLMSDGANTKSPTYPLHTGSNVSKANQLTQELCTKIKDTGVEIFTVALSVTDTGALQLMSECASGASYVYSVLNASELSAAFADIGGSISHVRLVH